MVNPTELERAVQEAVARAPLFKSKPPRECAAPGPLLTATKAGADWVYEWLARPATWPNLHDDKLKLQIARRVHGRLAREYRQRVKEAESAAWLPPLTPDDFRQFNEAFALKALEAGARAMAEQIARHGF